MTVLSRKNRSIVAGGFDTFLFVSATSSPNESIMLHWAPRTQFNFVPDRLNNGFVWWSSFPDRNGHSRLLVTNFLRALGSDDGLRTPVHLTHILIHVVESSVKSIAGDEDEVFDRKCIARH